MYEYNQMYLTKSLLMGNYMFSVVRYYKQCWGLVWVWFFGRFLEIQSDDIFTLMDITKQVLNQLSWESWSAAGMKMRGATRSLGILWS